MAHVHQREGVVVGTGEEHGIVALRGRGFLAVVIGRGGSIGDDGLVAFLAGAVDDPVSDGGGDGGILLVGVGGAGSLGVPVDIQGGDGGVKVLDGGDILADQGISGFLGGLHGLIAVRVNLIRLELAGGEVVGVVGEGGILLVVLALSGAQVGVGIGQGRRIAVAVGTGEGVEGNVLSVAFLRCAVAVLGFQEVLGAGIAVQVGIELHAVNGAVDIGKIVLGQGEACGLSGVCQGVGAAGVVLGGVQEIVRPGQAGVIVDDLLVQGLGGVQTKHGGVAAVVGVKAVDGAHIEVVQLGIADLVIAHGQCHGVPLVDTAVSDASGDANGDREYHHDSQNDDKNGGVKRQFLCFLLLSDLFFRHFGGLLLIAKLLLAGCAHVIKSSHLSFWS